MADAELESCSMMKRLIVAALLLLAVPSAQAGPKRWFKWLKPSRLEIVAWGLNEAATAADIESTANCFRQSISCQERNSWLYGTHPSRARMYSMRFSIDFGAYVLGHAIHRDSGLHNADLLLMPIPETVMSGVAVWSNVHLAQQLPQGRLFHRENFK
jgi:hypothetical protein